MPLDLFFKGLILGLSIAAPVGPIGVLCIRRTLAQGRRVGFVSGLGAATADAFYGVVAAFGLTVISGFLQDQSAWLRVIGGAFLIFLGVRTFRARPANGESLQSHQATDSQAQLMGAYLSTLVLTITNPATILSFTLMFAGIGGGGEKGLGSAGSLVAGVFGGSALWWLSLSLGIGFLRGRFNSAWMTWINRLSGAILVVFGLVILVYPVKGAGDGFLPT